MGIRQSIAFIEVKAKVFILIELAAYCLSVSGVRVLAYLRVIHEQAVRPIGFQRKQKFARGRVALLAAKDSLSSGYRLWRNHSAKTAVLTRRAV